MKYPLSPPKYLFHYREAESIAFLREGTLRLGNARRFDDRRDCRLPAGDMGFCCLSREELQNAIFSYGIVCLSELHNNPDMWSDYGGNHEGFCLGFDTAKLGYHVRPIFYSDRKRVVEMMVRQTGPVIEFPPAMTIKNTKWARQKEWRIITGEPGANIKYHPDALRAIYLGANAELGMVAEIQDIVKKKYSNLNKPKIYRGRINKKGNRVLFSPLL